MNKFLNLKALLLLIIVVLSGVLIYKSVSSDKSKKADTNIPMSDLVMDLKRQVVKMDSISLKKNGYSIYKLDEVEIEMNVVIKDSTTGDGQIQYRVLTEGSKEKYKKEVIQKITFHLKRPKS